MTSPRSRQASQAETRSRLLEVTEELVAEVGYLNVSLERIAARAGYTKGAVYSNFSSKEELTLAMLDQHFEHWLDELRRRLDAVPAEPEKRIETLTEWWSELVLHERWGVVILELAGATRDRPAIQQAMAERQEMIISFCALLVQREIDALGLELEMSARDLAEALVALGEGLSFARSLDPRVSAGVLTVAARAMLLGPRPAPSRVPAEVSSGPEPAAD